MIKYRAEFNNITPMEVVRETKLFVVLPENGLGRERKEAKRSDWSNYYDTWVEAHAALLLKADEAVTRARLTLERVKGTQGQIKGMKDPTTGGAA